jgi:hypothetical protein
MPPPSDVSLKPGNGVAAMSELTNDIRGIKSPVEIFDPWFWIIWAIVGAASVLLAWWLWRRWRRRIPETGAMATVPAHERARERLRAALAYIHDPRPFCIAVSHAIRVYLEERFQLRAPERTTEEFLDELRASALLTLDQKQTLGEFLQRCDLVKFAQFEPTVEELQRLHDAAVRLIDETEPFGPAGQSTETGTTPPSEELRT